MIQAISYLRRSTELEAQDKSYSRQEFIINDFCQREGIAIVKTFSEAASGADNNRTQLGLAIESAKKTGMPIIVSSISRLSRSVSFGSSLLEDKSIKIIVADLGMEVDKFLLNILLAVSQKERETTSARVKSQLANLKQQGVQLGNPRWNESIGKARAVRKLNAANRRVKYYQAIKMIKASGISSYNGIANAMNKLGMKSPRGGTISHKYVRDLILADK